MKNYLLLGSFLPLIFAFWSVPIRAQHIPMVHDANGQEIGSLEVYQGGGTTATVLKKNGVWIQLDLETGQITDGRAVSFENKNCIGPAWVNGPPDFVSRIFRAGTADPTGELFLLAKDAEKSYTVIQSSITTGGCNLHDYAGEFTALSRINTEEYGLVLNSGVWVFPPPLQIVIKTIVQPEVIYCSGFENCPQQ